jgi:hypothetical protein
VLLHQPTGRWDDVVISPSIKDEDIPTKFLKDSNELNII